MAKGLPQKEFQEAFKNRIKTANSWTLMILTKFSLLILLANSFCIILTWICLWPDHAIVNYTLIVLAKGISRQEKRQFPRITVRILPSVYDNELLNHS